MALEMLGAMIGGLGLFLLAVGMITDGLRMTAGDALRDLLGRWTKTPLRGIASGALITGIVQSSSAVTVATIGFVNANLLTMHQALGVVFGANIGTTMTGWLVAAVGFKIKVEAFALPMIGIGMILRLTGAGSRRAAIGGALAGFGLFFIGIDVLRGAFEGLAQGVELAALASESLPGLMMFVGVGAFMTLMTQSSSAAIAITLTAATGGVIGLPAAAAMVIGANVGTTSTAVFAAIGATANARRVATAHVIFNLATGVVALMLLPVLLWLVRQAGAVLALEAVPAVILALFHTLFNVLGVLLMWPFTGRLAGLLERRFVTPAEDLSRPQYLDRTTSSTPLLAQDAMRLELRRVLGMNRELALAALQPPVDARQFEGRQQAVMLLCDRIDASVAHLERSGLSADESAALPVVLRLVRRMREIAYEASQLVNQGLDCPQARPLVSETITVLKAWQPQDDLYSSTLSDQFHELHHRYERARKDVLKATATGQFQPVQANALLDQLRALGRLNSQLAKAGRQLQKQLRDEETVTESPHLPSGALVGNPRTTQ
ncbi:Na/Pi cotransporter family protein [Marinobacter sp. CA1]|uniref:Na/Pi cotransporter family protein n=1 Tax=Marinobacter sp. CA1 TaxID=2817656 RepID=UPI001D06DD80|nr:Na/Pi symporter [Marinobacter sp. CA1]UDL06155.1 Na/Pi cotransporter family protein [Marinobacter sp. CA1]